MDPSYEFNEWALRRRALRLAALKKSATTSCQTDASLPVWKSKFYGAFVLSRRVVLHAIDGAPDPLVDFHTGPRTAATTQAKCSCPKYHPLKRGKSPALSRRCASSTSRASGAAQTSTSQRFPRCRRCPSGAWSSSTSTPSGGARTRRTSGNLLHHNSRKIERLNGAAAVSDKFSDEPLGLNSGGSPAAPRLALYSFFA